MMNALMAADSEMRYASSPRIGLEIAMLRLCREEAGTDNAALAERVAELERKIANLPEQLAQHQAEPVKQAPSTNAASSQNTTVDSAVSTPAVAYRPQPEPTLELPREKQAIQQSDLDTWKAALKKLAENQPPLSTLLKMERFLGAKDGVFRVQVPQERKAFSFARLKQQGIVDVIAQALTDVAQRPLRFEAVLEGSPHRKADVSESIQMLADTIGRDLLQIDESEE